MNQELKFPKDFLFGAGVSVYQVEGNIENSDWSRDFPAGKACDHYNLYEQDFDLIKQLNLNAFRFSIEWSRIEPEPGKFDQKQIEHYRKYLESLKSRGIKTMVTLHHFTNPVWLAEKGGWTNKKSIFYFSRFCRKMLEQYSDLVDSWITINEPISVYAAMGYLTGEWPPKKKNPILFLKVVKNQISAHKKIYEIFHKIDPNVKVSIAKNNAFIEPVNKFALNRFSAFCADYFGNQFFLDKIKNHLDFIGLNCYFHAKVK